ATISSTGLDCCCIFRAPVEWSVGLRAALLSLCGFAFRGFVEWGESLPTREGRNIGRCGKSHTKNPRRRRDSNYKVVGVRSRMRTCRGARAQPKRAVLRYGNRDLRRAHAPLARGDDGETRFRLVICEQLGDIVGAEGLAEEIALDLVAVVLVQ